MATAYIRAESPPTYPLQLPPRAAIEAAIEALTAVIDAMDGDADEEPDGDEHDTSFAEDEFASARNRIYDIGPGCPIADPDYAVDDLPCDPESDNGY